MTSSYKDHRGVTQRGLLCRNCSEVAAVEFGPCGFQVACAICGQREQLDELLEPVWFPDLRDAPVLAPPHALAIVPDAPHQVALVPKEKHELAAVS